MQQVSAAAVTFLVNSSALISLRHGPGKGAPLGRSRLPGCVHFHKWIWSPKGSAFLYARKEVQHLVEPLAVSWGWQPEKTTLLSLDSAGGPPSPFIQQQEWQGTRDTAAYLSVPAAIQFQAEHDWSQVWQQCHDLLRYARQAISDVTGLDSPEWYAQVATIPPVPCDPDELKRRLYDEYRVEVPTAFDRAVLRG